MTALGIRWPPNGNKLAEQHTAHAEYPPAYLDLNPIVDEDRNSNHERLAGLHAVYPRQNIDGVRAEDCRIPMYK